MNEPASSPERPHDMGGRPAGPIDQTDHVLADWEVLAETVAYTLSDKGLRRVDESRRAIEDLEAYARLSYYERWVAATETLLVEKGILTPEEIDRKMAEIDDRWGTKP